MEEPLYQAKTHYQNKDVAEGYDEVRFQGWKGRLAHRREEAALRRMVRRHCAKGKKVLDLPCGTGRFFPVFLGHQMSVLGADISENMMAVAKRNYEGRYPVEFMKLDAEKLDLSDQSVDVTVSFRFMCHLPPHRRDCVIREMIRVTRDVLIINYHFEVWSPLNAISLLINSKNRPKYPLKKQEFLQSLEKIPNVRLMDIRPLDWYERSSCLVVLKKVPAAGGTTQRGA